MINIFVSSGLIVAVGLFLFPLQGDCTFNINSKCGSLPEVENGVVAKVEILFQHNRKRVLVKKETVFYTCNENFVFSGGNNKSFCRRTGWRPILRCVPVDTTTTKRTTTTTLPTTTTTTPPTTTTQRRITCPNPPEVNNGRFMGGSLSVGATQKLRCTAGYRRRGKAKIRCRRNGTWSRHGRCIRQPTTATRSTRTTTKRTTPITQRTRRPPRTTTTRVITTTVEATSSLTQPRRGPQCKYGKRHPHALCQRDSSNLVTMEPVDIAETLDRHNYWRGNVSPPARNMPNLKWDEDLAITAERWASTCPSGHDDKSQRVLPARDGKEEWVWVGQNLYWHSHNASMTAAIDSWASELKDWYYGMSNPTEVVGHYTQIIWAKTLYVGCGKSYCRNTRFATTIACNYGPGGNVATERRDGKWLNYAYPYELQ